MLQSAHEPVVRLHTDDNVVTATKNVRDGQLVSGVEVRQPVPKGHKIAVAEIAKGEPVKKYAQVIGYAAQNIKKGEHVHDHNVEFRNTNAKYQFAKNLVSVEAKSTDTFMGYKRKNGKVGTRNYIAIITSVNCSATAARKIAAAFGEKELKKYPNVDGVVAFVHGTGCGLATDSEGFFALQRIMWGYASHPNNGGVLMVGLGCEINQIDWLLEAHGIKRSSTLEVMNIQNVAGLQKTVEVGIQKIKKMLPYVNKAKRQKCPASALTVALQCGGSDAWSGITANPALGYACDLLVKQGGTGVLAETPEIYGAEHLLAKRAKDVKVGKKLIDRIKWWEKYTKINNASLNNNPSPGNKKGGLSTILEKSLGATAKAGTTPLNDVYLYGEPVRQTGFVFMDSPGYDPASVTGQIASGCNLVTFTTGRGSAFGSKPAPTIKIATNNDLYKKMKDDMDVNAGEILDNNQTVEEVGKQIYKKMLDTASGKKTKSEKQGLGDEEFVPWQIGATL